MDPKLFFRIQEAMQREHFSQNRNPILCPRVPQNPPVAIIPPYSGTFYYITPFKRYRFIQVERFPKYYRVAEEDINNDKNAPNWVEISRVPLMYCSWLGLAGEFF